MKALKLGLIAIGMMAMTNIQAQEQRETPAQEVPAKQNKKKKARNHFKQMDINNDGFIDLSELQKAKGDASKDQVKRFNKIDTNNDARISPEEYKKARKKRKAKKGQRAATTR